MKRLVFCAEALMTLMIMVRKFKIVFSSINNVSFNKTIALYVRVSTEMQVDGFSIDGQIERLKAYCVAMGWSNYKIYCDGGYSGSNLDRPKLQEMIVDIENGKISAVLVYKLDRLSRAQKDTLFLIEDVFMPNNIAFISLNESLDTSSPYGRAMIGILSAFAQLERESIRLRTQMGQIERVKQGYWHGGGGVPFGYNYDRNIGILVPDPEEAPVVRAIYDLFLRGYTLGYITKTFGFNSNQIVKQIIMRRSNTGVVTYKDEVYAGLHEPLIDEATYNLAMEQLNARSKRRASRTQYHILTGLIYCGYCGAKARYATWSKRGCKLICYSRNKTRPYMSTEKSDNCTLGSVWADEVEAIVLEDLFRISVSLPQNKYLSEIINPIDILQDKIKTLTRKIEKLYNHFGESNDIILKEVISKNQEQLNELKDKLAYEMNNRPQRLEKSFVHNGLVNLRDLWPLLSKEERQTVVRNFVERVDVFNDYIEIHYKVDIVSQNNKAIA